ncbi:hypothetical protein ACFC1T_36545 [Kitasatospora sp. NPDC056076]|uniref:hypothetical protein n=1 Tax=Kitasatospora sp. NPDC056076 TaxID=3345703 RepID=UPI0035D84B92
MSKHRVPGPIGGGPVRPSAVDRQLRGGAEVEWSPGLAALPGVGDEGGADPAAVEQVRAPVPDGDLLAVQRLDVRAAGLGEGGGDGATGLRPPAGAWAARSSMAAAGFGPALRCVVVGCAACGTVGDLVPFAEAVAELDRWADHVEAEHGPSFVQPTFLRMEIAAVNAPAGCDDPAAWLADLNERRYKRGHPEG